MARICGAQALLAAALLTATVVVAAPSSKAAARKAASVKNSHRAAMDSKSRAPKRAKREVFLEESPSEDDEEEGVRRQLQDLSDQQLFLLAEIVQNEIDKYDPVQEEYEIVQLPPEVMEDLVADDDVVLIPSRATRSVMPIVEYDEAPQVIDDEVETEEAPELVVIPEEVVSDDELDELELRQRIAEIAQILNERASRRIEFV